MTQIKYITTDLDLRASEDLSGLAHELCGENEQPNFSDWVKEEYWVVIDGLGEYEEPEKEIVKICNKIENLSPDANKLWKNCFHKVLNIGFRSGEKPDHKSFNITPKTIERLSKLDLGIEMRLYPITI